MVFHHKRDPRPPVSGQSDVIYGRWPVREALEGGKATKIFIARGAAGKPVEEIVSLARASKIPFHFLDRVQLDRMAPGLHQGVAAQIAAAKTSELADVLAAALASREGGPGVLFLDGITDPHNVGSILRSAVFFGVRAVVIPKWRSASLTGTVVKASAGAAHFVAIAQVSNLVNAMERAKESGLWIVGADMGGRDVKGVDIPRPFGLVLGAEGSGLHELVKKKCDLLVSIGKIRREKGIDSLNVSAACAVFLHQLT